MHTKKEDHLQSQRQMEIAGGDLYPKRGSYPKMT